MRAKPRVMRYEEDPGEEFDEQSCYIRTDNNSGFNLYLQRSGAHPDDGDSSFREAIVKIVHGMAQTSLVGLSADNLRDVASFLNDYANLLDG